MLIIETYQDKFNSLSDHTHDMELKTNNNRGSVCQSWRLDKEGVLRAIANGSVCNKSLRKSLQWLACFQKKRKSILKPNSMTLLLQYWATRITPEKKSFLTAAQAPRRFGTISRNSSKGRKALPKSTFYNYSTNTRLDSESLEIDAYLKSMEQVLRRL